MAKQKSEKSVRMEINDKTGEVLAVYLHIRDGKSAKVKEFAAGNAYADYDKDGQLLGIELLGPCEVEVLDQIAQAEPKPVQTFVRDTIPRKMIVVGSVFTPRKATSARAPSRRPTVDR